MSAAAVLLALALAPAAAAPDGLPTEYSLRLRFERDGESRLFQSNVHLGESYSTVLASSGAAREHLIVNVMPMAAEDARGFELLYQVEWDVRGAVLQAQDSAQVAPGEDALLSSQAGAWSLRAVVEPAFDFDTCAPRPSGGGLLVTARVRLGGRERVVTRRTMPNVMSNVLYSEPGGEPFTLGLEVQPTSKERPAVVRFVAEQGERSLGGVKARAEVPFEAETLVAGDGLGDAAWVTLSSLPVRWPVKVAVPEVLDPSGWLRHAGPVLTFLHPPRWQVQPDCGPDLAPTGWHLVDTSLPESQRPGTVITVYRAPPAPGTPAEIAAARIAALPAARRKAPETLKLAGGECVYWSVDDEVRTAHAVCEAGVGFPLEALLVFPEGGRDPAPDFKRLLGSLAPRRR